MSDEEGSEPEEQQESGGKSLDQVYVEFKDKIGHYPHDIKQLLAYCKNNNYPYKFVQIKDFWPKRPNPEAKPKPKAVNADQYKENAAAAADDQKDDEDAPKASKGDEDKPAEEPKAAEPQAEEAAEEDEEEEEEDD